MNENKHDIKLLLKYRAHEINCPSCHSKDYDKYGCKLVNFMDIPIRGKRVVLTIRLQRYKCKSCAKLYQDHTPGMSQDYRMTERLVEYVKRHSGNTSFTKLSEEIGVSEGSIRKIFADMRKLEPVKRQAPRIMGIDEIYLAGKPRCVITDIENHSMVEMLENRNKITVSKYLAALDSKDKIEFVAMDMWRPYKDVVAAHLPSSRIVIDKFHVLRMANMVVETYRKEIRRTLPATKRRDLKNDRYILSKREADLNFVQTLVLSYWSENYPSLGKICRLKEEFYAIYDAANKIEAYDRYATWESQLTSDIRRYYEPLVKAVANWHHEIFAYFDKPITNAYTEALNSVIRHINEMGRGYSFETIRAKMLHLNLKQKRPKLNKKWGDADESIFARLVQIFYSLLGRILGRGISTMAL